jgi:hypothetical protein
LSQPCCLDRGVDACGAELFCAAFDGHTQATCYPEFSRQDQTECTADNQCSSQHCNLDLGKCMSTPGLACSADIGCAPDLMSNRYFCNTAQASPTCNMVGDGKAGAACGQDADCAGGHCRLGDMRCLAALGESCEWGDCVCFGGCGGPCQPDSCAANNCFAGTCSVDCEHNSGVCK